MEERKELIRRYLSFAKNATNDELRRYNDIMKNASKPKSQVKRMVELVEYFNANPITPHPRKNITQTRGALGVYSRAFKVNIRNIFDPMIQLQETRSEVKRSLGDFFGEMGGFKFSETSNIMSEGSNWVIVQVHRQCISVAKYNPLEESSWLDLPPELKNPKYGLVNMKNKDNEFFRRCHIRRFNPQQKDPQRIRKEDRLLVDHYDYSGVD